MSENPIAKPDGVYFSLRDYANPLKRVIACATDFVLLVALFAGMGAVVGILLVPAEVRSQTRTVETQRQINRHMKPAQVPLALGWLALCVAYHVPLRRTRGGTIGHRLMRTRVVDKQGQPPAVRALFRRFFIAVPATMFFGISYFDCLRNPRRQTTHDQWSGTWVVRAGAKPVGPAITSYHPKLLGTFMMTYIGLEPVTSEAFEVPSP